jgi:predicted PurR-regulated permease PerM
MNRSEPIAGDYSAKQVRNIAYLFLTALGLYLCWLLAEPFLAAAAWALALAVVARPLHRQLERLLPPNLAASISIFVIVLILLAPGGFLIQQLADEARSGLAIAGENLNSARLHEAAEQYPSIAKALHWAQQRFDLDQEFRHAAGQLAGRASGVLGGSIRLVTNIVIMFVTLFYFLRDRERLLRFLSRLVPLSSIETDELFRRVSETIHATLYGNVIVKLVQGLLGGLMFWILGLPAPVVCGTAMALTAMIPIVGTSLIWGPAAIALLLQGSWIKAIVLILWGGLVVSLMDNLLYPILVASELRLHTLGVLFSIFGGLLAFGIAGAVLGPIILASTVALFEVWRLRDRHVPEVAPEMAQQSNYQGTAK